MKEFKKLVRENFERYDKRAWVNTVNPLASALDEKFAEIEAKLEALKTFDFGKSNPLDVGYSGFYGIYALEPKQQGEETTMSMGWVGEAKNMNEAIEKMSKLLSDFPDHNMVIIPSFISVSKPSKYFDEAQGKIVNTTILPGVTRTDYPDGTFEVEVDLKRGDHNHLVTYYTAMDCSEMIRVSVSIWRGEATEDMVSIEFDPYNKIDSKSHMWDAEDWVLSLDDPSGEQVLELMEEYNHVKTQYGNTFSEFLLEVRDCVRDVKLFIEKYNS